MRILIAEDSPVYTHLLQGLLTGWGYEVQSVSNGEDALLALAIAGAPRLAILDWSMPKASGIKVCRQLRSAKLKHYTYILILTAHCDNDELVQAFDAGVDDYLTKPFNDRELEARLRAGRRIIGLQDGLIAIGESLRHQSFHDALTGVWNRDATLDFLQRQLARARRESGSPVSVIMVGVDHFKRVAETHGHVAGDAVLRETAQHLRANVRSYDGVGRLGSDQFVIVLPGCSLENAGSRADSLRAEIAHRPIEGGPAPLPITVSMGVAAASRESDLQNVLAAAAAALAEARRNGGNTVEVGLELPPLRQDVPGIQTPRPTSTTFFA